ncbi:MAG TPA: serine hydrolase [Pirellulaceae bacterium]|nr:serine hydrolase [Pirellulaceae bacterium]HMO93980.1 serine hydrolase [Pirellulaceae bacterium]HMP70864.1 serine hydrolase [Pirellulaceae bacterium]
MTKKFYHFRIDKGWFNISFCSTACRLLSVFCAYSYAANGQGQDFAGAHDQGPADTKITQEERLDDEQLRFTRSADYSADHSGRAFLVLRDGEIVFERYDNGWSANRPHLLASGTKSFAGVLAMLAVEDGLLSLDELVSETIDEWKDHPKKSQITIRQLLTLSSGLPAGDQDLAGGRSGALSLGEMADRRARRLGIEDSNVRPENQNQRAVDLELETEPGTKFQYGPSHFYVFSEVLQRKLKASGAVQQTTMAYLNERLLKPIGIQNARIGRDRAGNPNLPGGMFLTARDWAKFGQFVLDGGSVRQADGQMKSLLSSELLNQCFEPSERNKSYGLTWWLRAANSEADQLALLGRTERVRQDSETALKKDGKPVTVYMAAGLGKQRLYVLPEFNMVIVRFAEASVAGQRYSDAQLLKMILDVD